MFEYSNETDLVLVVGMGHLENEFGGFQCFLSAYGCLLCFEFMKFEMLVIVHELLLFVLGFKNGCLLFMWNNYLLKLLCSTFHVDCICLQLCLNFFSYSRELLLLFFLFYYVFFKIQLLQSYVCQITYNKIHSIVYTS